MKNKDNTPESLDTKSRALWGRIGAYTLHAQYDAKETTQKARQTFLSRFEKEVDPEGKLPLDERLKRAEAAKKAYFTRLSFQSAKARRKQCSSPPDL